MDTNFKVFIDKGPDFDGIKIWLVQDYGNGQYAVAKPVEFIFEKTKDNVFTEPTIRLNAFFAKEFLKAWAEAIKKEKIAIEDTSKLEGEISATKYHLEDMRKIVFKENKNDKAE